MYRLLIAVLLCLEAASPAPQAKDSDVTYVKIQPVVEDTPLQPAASTRESRIEKLPLTIPGNLSTTGKEPDKEDTTIEVSEGNIPETTTEKKLNEPIPDSVEPKLEGKDVSDASDNLEESETKQSEQIASTDEASTTDDLSEVSPTDDLSVSHSENQPDTFSEPSLSERRGRNFESIETTETVEYATERYEDDLIDHTIIEAPRTKAPPKFIPKTPKLSYYPKPRVFQSYSANHLEIVGKRKFKSRCSCQKIWNCPKLQISVPRCPDEYFLCCF